MSMVDNLNYMNFGIMGYGGEKVKAGAGFIYKGYIISMSTVFNNPAVAVFVDVDGGEIVYEASSVEDAIKWVDSNG